MVISMKDEGAYPFGEITLEHGAGGEAYRELVERVFLPAYGSKELSAMNDSAVVDLHGAKLAFTTDGFVVRPLEFPGGDIGSLCVSGTVNDLAVSGAVPRYISVSMILEAGLPVKTLVRVAESMAKTAKLAGVSIVAGDTKVVERGRADGMYITTAGVGEFTGCWEMPSQRVEPGDVIIVSGTVANHGIAVMAAREGLEFSPEIESDAAPVNSPVRAALETGLPVHALRDPTRGGVGAVLCEWGRADADITLYEGALPLRPNTAAACRLLGIEPLFCANEGIFMLSTPEEHADAILAALRACPMGRDAAVIARVTEGEGRVYARTAIGTKRRIFLPRGELLPRIC